MTTQVANFRGRSMRHLGPLSIFCGCALLVGCEASYEPKHLLKGADAWACVSEGDLADRCEGKSVELDGMVQKYEDGGWELLKEGKSDRFRAIGGAKYLEEGASVRIRGLVVDGGFWSHPTTISIHDSEVLAAAPKREREVTAEEMIALNREMGRRALEEADAAIRANNADLKNALAARAIDHHVRNSGDTLIDVYRMPDGRIIGCETVVHPSSAPITTCDGEP